MLEISVIGERGRDFPLNGVSGDIKGAASDGRIAVSVIVERY